MENGDTKLWFDASKDSAYILLNSANSNKISKTHDRHDAHTEKIEVEYFIR